MNIKKIITGVVSLALVSAIGVPLSDIQQGYQVSATQVSTTETSTTTESVSTSKTYSSWQEAYDSILQDDDFFEEVYNSGYVDDSDTEYSGVGSLYFDLIYLDSDDIPELAVYFTGPHYSGPSIVKYDKTSGTVGFILRSDSPTIHDSEYGQFGTLEYIEKKGIIYDSETGMGIQSIEMFSVSGYTAKLKDVYSVSNEYESDGEVEKVCYYNGYYGEDDKTEVALDDVVKAIEAYGLTYTGSNKYNFLEFDGLKTLDLENSSENLNTKANRDRIINSASKITSENQCGDKAYWSFDEVSGTLTISGSGAMYDYSLSNPSPFGDVSTNVKKIVVDEGITTIGDYAFYVGTYDSSLYTVTSVSLPSTLTKIGNSAFAGFLDNLEEINIPNGVTEIGDEAFLKMTSTTVPNSIKVMTLPQSLTTIGKYAIGYICEDGETYVLEDDFVIQGYKGSQAETYAEDNGISFVKTTAIEPTPIEPLPNDDDNVEPDDDAEPSEDSKEEETITETSESESESESSDTDTSDTSSSDDDDSSPYTSDSGVAPIALGGLLCLASAVLLKKKD